MRPGKVLAQVVVRFEGGPRRRRTQVVDAMSRETSVSSIYAADDLTIR
jgi:hypothetical protein